MRHTQRGIAMIEILGVLLISAMLFKGISSMVDSSMEDNKALQTAQYQAQMVQAAADYLSANYATLADPAKVGLLTRVEVAELITAAVLPPGVGATNPYGQATCLLIVPRNKVVGASTVVVLDALVATAGSAAQAIPETVLAFAAANAGPGGGYISSRAPDVVQGSSGTWKIGVATTPSLGTLTSATCSGNTMAAGSLASALFGERPGQATDFLYRDNVPGMPELNQMNTPLVLKNAAQVVSGAACTDAAIAVDADRNLMQCNKLNVWQRVGSSSWKDPVDDHPALLALSDPEAGDVRMVKSLGRAFTYGGSAWTALAEDENGDLKVSRNLSVGQDASVGRDLVAENDVKARRDATAARNVEAGVDITAARDIKATGNIIADGDSRGKNLIADIDVTATRGFYGRYVNVKDGYVDVSNGWVATGQVQVQLPAAPGERCHIRHQDPETRQWGFYMPLHTIRIDSTAPPGQKVPLICSGTDSSDARYVYFNGQLTR